MRKSLNVFVRSAIPMALAVLSAPLYAQVGPVTGAVFTTGPGCQTVNGNIYDLKEYVYLDGGPARPGSAGLLSSTSYYVQVTDPSGKIVLGSSVNMANPRPIATNLLGDVVGCFPLKDIVMSPTTNAPGFDDTPNVGGEYKVWIGIEPTFTNQYTKTDNFKVKGPVRPGDPVGSIKIIKFYDANANGDNDDGMELIGWRVDLMGNQIKSTPAEYTDLTVVGGQSYTAREYQPNEANWYATSPGPITTTPPYLNQSTVQLDPEHLFKQVEFGNVCTGAGGGLTIGFWSNKNGQAAIDAYQRKPPKVSIYTQLTNLPLVNATGKDFDPAQYADQLRPWLLNATAQNMAYMLSVQYAAMYLNVTLGFVDPSAMIYAAGSPSANKAGFATVQQVMDDAKNSLATQDANYNYVAKYTPPGSPYRAVQESIKNALDAANNNRTFVMKKPCGFTFPLLPSTTLTTTP